MKIWAVFIRQSGPAGEYLQRWIDTEWADFAHATERAAILKDTFRAFGVNKHDAFVIEMKVMDAEIIKKPKDAA